MQMATQTGPGTRLLAGAALAALAAAVCVLLRARQAVLDAQRHGERRLEVAVRALARARRAGRELDKMAGMRLQERQGRIRAERVRRVRGGAGRCGAGQGRVGRGRAGLSGTLRRMRLLGPSHPGTGICSHAPSS